MHYYNRESEREELSRLTKNLPKIMKEIRVRERDELFDLARNLPEIKRETFENRLFFIKNVMRYGKEFYSKSEEAQEEYEEFLWCLLTQTVIREDKTNKKLYVLPKIPLPDFGEAIIELALLKKFLGYEVKFVPRSFPDKEFMKRDEKRYGELESTIMKLNLQRIKNDNE